MGPLGNAPLPAVIPSVVAGCSCIDRPIPSNFLSDKGQKSNDKFADLLPREQRQAGGAPEIRGGWALESTGHPRCSQPWNHGEGVGGVGGGGVQLQDVCLATPKNMNEGGSGKLTNA